MSDDYERRPDDHLVEPLFGALEPASTKRVAGRALWTFAFIVAAVVAWWALA